MPPYAPPPTCSNCQLWIRREGGGQCKRYPPNVFASPAPDGSGAIRWDQAWPWTNPDNFCGEHRPAT